jgi:dipeptidyl aminopeptidase/acylaminoacyl peptidase
MGNSWTNLSSERGKFYRYYRPVAVGILAAILLLAWPQLLKAQKAPTVTPVSYKLADGTRLTGYLSLPQDYRQGEKSPAILLIHGYRGVSRSRPQGLAAGWLKLKIHQKYLLQHYVVFSAEYYADYLGDTREFQSLAAALQTMATLPQVDPERIAAVGASHGGYLALMSMMHPVIQPKPKAAVSICGVVDVAEWVKYLQAEKDNPCLLPGLRQYACSTIPRALGWPPDKDIGTRKKFDYVSVLRYVENLKGPLLVVHGDKDIQVPSCQAQMLRKALPQEDKKVEFHMVPAGGHFIFRDSQAVWEKIDDFLKRTL